MRKREIAVLICKVLSLYAIMMAIETLPQAFRTISQVGSTLMAASANSGLRGGTFSSAQGLVSAQTAPLILISALFPCTLQLTVAIGLWLGAAPLAERMVVEYPDDPPIDLRGVDVKGIAFASIGLLQLVQTVPTLLHALASQIWNALVWTAPITTYGYYTWATLFRAVMGLGLVLGWRGIIGSIRSLQNMGKPTTPETPVTSQSTS